MGNEKYLCHLLSAIYPRSHAVVKARVVIITCSTMQLESNVSNGNIKLTSLHPRVIVFKHIKLKKIIYAVEATIISW
jgi:hypothetical protein